MNIKLLLDRKILLLIGGGVVMFSLLYSFMIKPQHKQLMTVKEEIYEKEVLYANLSALSSVIDELREAKSSISETVDRFIKVIEKGETGLVVPANLMEIFGDSKVRVISIKPVPERVEGELLISSWDINIVAGYHELGDFISRIERSTDFNHIDSLNISAGTDSPEHTTKLVVSRISLLKG